MSYIDNSSSYSKCLPSNESASSTLSALKLVYIPDLSQRLALNWAYISFEEMLFLLFVLLSRLEVLNVNATDGGVFNATIDIWVKQKQSGNLS